MSARDLWQQGVDFVLTFVNRGGAQRRVGPLKALRMDGKAVRSEIMNVDSCYGVEAGGPVTVQFEGGEQRSGSFGPFKRFSVVDRLVYADGKAFAFFNPAWQAWLCYDSGRYWPSMVVSASMTPSPAKTPPYAGMLW